MAEDGLRPRLLIRPNGERFPLVIGGKNIPDWEVTLFTSTQLRAKQLTPNSIAATLDAIRLLYRWAAKDRIDLEQCLVTKRYLQEIQVCSLASYLGERASPSVDGQAPNVISLPSASHRSRARIRKPDEAVLPSTLYNRITYVAEFLVWLARYVLDRSMQGIDSDAHVGIELMRTLLLAKRPRRVQAGRKERLGLPEPSQDALLDLFRHDQPNNPFSASVRLRNEIAIDLLSMGLRPGELLSLKVSDFDFQAQEVVVARRHGDASDPRARQPVAKTLDRRLPMRDELSRLISQYVLVERRALSAARRHGFLLVTHKSGPDQGAPLSYRGLAKIFQTIRAADPVRFGSLSAHVLRHTANDRFSEMMERSATSASKEEKLRSYVMGWKEGSGTAAVYTKRHTRKKAREASLQLQRRPERNADRD
jgi:integrase